MVRFENSGDESLTVERFAVETPTLDDGLERSKPFEVAADDAIAIRLDLPESRCDADPGPVVVGIMARTASGAEAEGERHL